MSNLFAPKAQENERAQTVMGMFRHAGLSFSVQPWREKERIFHLHVNERSGKDLWFSSLLDSCRTGTMSEQDYNWLHGSFTTIIIFFDHRYIT